jgi:hypothetical protein
MHRGRPLRPAFFIEKSPCDTAGKSQEDMLPQLPNFMILRPLPLSMLPLSSVAKFFATFYFCSSLSLGRNGMVSMPGTVMRHTIMKNVL